MLPLLLRFQSVQSVQSMDFYSSNNIILTLHNLKQIHFLYTESCFQLNETKSVKTKTGNKNVDLINSRSLIIQLDFNRNRALNCNFSVHSIKRWRIAVKRNEFTGIHSTSFCCTNSVSQRKSVRLLISLFCFLFKRQLSKLDTKSDVTKHWLTFQTGMQTISNKTKPVTFFEKTNVLHRYQP